MLYDTMYIGICQLDSLEKMVFLAGYNYLGGSEMISRDTWWNIWLVVYNILPPSSR